MKKTLQRGVSRAAVGFTDFFGISPLPGTKVPSGPSFEDADEDSEDQPYWLQDQFWPKESDNFKNDFPNNNNNNNNNNNGNNSNRSSNSPRNSTAINNNNNISSSSPTSVPINIDNNKNSNGNGVIPSAPSFDDEISKSSDEDESPPDYIPVIPQTNPELKQEATTQDDERIARRLQEEEKQRYDDQQRQKKNKEDSNNNQRSDPFVNMDSPGLVPTTGIARGTMRGRGRGRGRGRAAAKMVQETVPDEKSPNQKRVRPPLVQSKSFLTRGSSDKQTLRGRGRGRYLRGTKGFPGQPVGRETDDDAAPRAPKSQSEHRAYFIVLVSLVDITILIYEIIYNNGFAPFLDNPWFGPSKDTLVDLGAKFTPKLVIGEWWRLLTAIFIHSGVIHLFINLLIQLRIGRQLEISYGVLRVAPIYLLCGFFGNICSAIFLPSNIEVGANGALFGFLGVLLTDLLQNWKSLQNPGRNLILLLIVIIIALAIGLLPGIDDFCHIGGFIMGILTGFIFIPNITYGKCEARWRTFVVCTFMPLVVILLTIGLVLVFAGLNAAEICPGCEELQCLQLFTWCDAVENAGLD